MQHAILKSERFHIELANNGHHGLLGLENHCSHPRGHYHFFCCFWTNIFLLGYVKQTKTVVYKSLTGQILIVAAHFTQAQ